MRDAPKFNYGQPEIRSPGQGGINRPLLYRGNFPVTGVNLQRRLPNVYQPTRFSVPPMGVEATHMRQASAGTSADHREQRIGHPNALQPPEAVAREGDSPRRRNLEAGHGVRETQRRAVEAGDGGGGEVSERRRGGEGEPPKTPKCNLGQLNQNTPFQLGRATQDIPLVVTDRGLPSWRIFALDKNVDHRVRVVEWYRNRHAASGDPGDFTPPDVASFPTKGTRELSAHTGDVLETVTPDTPVVITTNGKDTHIALPFDTEGYLRALIQESARAILNPDA